MFWHMGFTCWTPSRRMNACVSCDLGRQRRTRQVCFRLVFPSLPLLLNPTARDHRTGLLCVCPVQVLEPLRAKRSEGCGFERETGCSCMPVPLTFDAMMKGVFVRYFSRIVMTASVLAACAGVARATDVASPFASSVVSYTAGIGATGNDHAAAAVGAPTRFTGLQYGYPGNVHPFNPAFDPDETVTVGRGGSLVLAFDHRVENDAANPFGIDLLIFGNSFFWDPINFSLHADELSSEGGTVEVSQDGTHWVLANGVEADGLFPTLGYSDLTDPWSTTHGSVETDFTKPVDPNFDWVGKDFSQIITGYKGSGGGAGVDIGALGLQWIQFVRISNASGSHTTPEVDAISDVSPVPAPSAILVALVATGCGAVRRRRDASL